MAKTVKRNIKADEWKKLVPAVQELYVADPDDEESYLLNDDTQEHADLGRLRRANDRLKTERDDLRKARDAAEEKLASLETDSDKKNGDIEKLETRWLADKEELVKKHNDEVAVLRKYIESTAIDTIVANIATKYTDSAENSALLAPHLRSQLTVEFEDDGPVVKRRGDSGELTPLDLATFEKEVVDNKMFAAIIVASKASGGGAADDDTSGRRGSTSRKDRNGSGAGSQSEQPLLCDMSLKDLTATLRNR